MTDRRRLTDAEERALLGPDAVAEIDRAVADAPEPSPEQMAELVADLRPILAPAMAAVRTRRAAAQAPAEHEQSAA